MSRHYGNPNTIQTHKASGMISGRALNRQRKPIRTPRQRLPQRVLKKGKGTRSQLTRQSQIPRPKAKTNRRERERAVPNQAALLLPNPFNKGETLLHASFMPGESAQGLIAHSPTTRQPLQLQQHPQPRQRHLPPSQRPRQLRLWLLIFVALAQ